MTTTHKFPPQVLAASLLDYLRQLQLLSLAGTEPKLPLLYRKLALLLHRQVMISFRLEFRFRLILRNLD